MKAEILEILKTNGISEAEDILMKVVKSAFAILKLVIPKVSKGLSTIINPMLDYVEPKILEAIDKIDGEDDFQE